ncbi:protein TsetseEP-like [Abeliophyllum distichum]|uniref:Protein TsetseEP-like n=1 Tax=Abeliophyllum distichum TaxID=126358 RepID=A0ABD1VYQ1_9LAMI
MVRVRQTARKSTGHGGAVNPNYLIFRAYEHFVPNLDTTIEQHVQRFHTAWERALEVVFQSTHAQAIARLIDTFSDEGQRVATAILRALEEDEPEDEAEPEQEIEPEPEVEQEVEAEAQGEIRHEAELESEPESTITSDDEAPPAKVPRVHGGWISEYDD